jgi:hypothetical protein
MHTLKKAEGEERRLGVDLVNFELSYEGIQVEVY